MRIATVIVPLLLGLAAAPALAQQAGAPPAKGSQGEMSYEDYLIQRAKMLLRMQGASPQQAQPPAKNATGKEGQDGGYGQGYASRKNAEDGAARKPRGEHERPEHPHVERPERPQIERPGRP